MIDPQEVHSRVMASPEYAAARERAEAANRDMIEAGQRLHEATSAVTRLYDDVIAQLRAEGR